MMVGAETEPRNSRSLPISAMPFSISCRVLAMVTSETGKRQFAVADPDAHRSARIIARNGIDTAADQFGHKKSVFHAAQ